MEWKETQLDNSKNYISCQVLSFTFMEWKETHLDNSQNYISCQVLGTHVRLELFIYILRNFKFEPLFRNIHIHKKISKYITRVFWFGSFGGVLRWKAAKLDSEMIVNFRAQNCTCLDFLLPIFGLGSCNMARA